jgi:hypothetical protein
MMTRKDASLGQNKMIEGTEKKSLFLELIMTEAD